MDNKNYRIQDIDEKLNMMRVYPLDVLVVGGTGAGKSSTLDMLLGEELAAIGRSYNPETQEVQDYSLNPKMRFWDSPGLGDGMENDKKHSKKLIDILYKEYTYGNERYGVIDLVLVVIDGSCRDMGTVFRLLNEVIVPNFPKDRILVVINQADMAMKGRHWNERLNAPDAVLKQFLEDKALSIQVRVEEATGVSIVKPVYYSAQKGYNVHKLLDHVIDHMPTERREFNRSCA